MRACAAKRRFTADSHIVRKMSGKATTASTKGVMSRKFVTELIGAIDTANSTSGGGVINLFPGGVYKIETPWVPALDAGIAWDSAGLDWPDKNPALSDKDRNLPRLAEFKSPFVYRAK